MGKITKNNSDETVEQYKQRVMAEICGCIAQNKPLMHILAANPSYPCYHTFIKWITEDDALMQSYMRAREQSADYMADEIIYISDTELDPQVARVRIDARKWVAAKMKPKKYGDRITHSGDSDSPIEIKHKYELSEDQLIAIAAGGSSRAIEASESSE